MTQTVGYIATWERTPTHDEQHAALAPTARTIVTDGEILPTKLKPVLRQLLVELKRGDTLVLHSLAVVPVALPALIPIITRLLKRGVSLRLVADDILFDAGADDVARRIVEALETQRRLVIGLKTRSNVKSTKRQGRIGRPPLLTDERWPEIQALVEKPGANHTEIAASLGVSRSTLFQYLKNHREARLRTH